MAAIDFPSNPSPGQNWPSPAVPGQPVYTWDGEKWVQLGATAITPSDALPLMDATPALAGTAVTYARGDHVHPSFFATALPLANAITAVVGTALKYAREDHVHPAAVTRFQLFTASGTYTPNANLVSAIVEVQAGGGAGGAVTGATGYTFIGGGGGGGGYCRRYLTAAEIGVSQAITIGAGGAGAAGGAGGTGGNSSFGALCVANGGGGGSLVSTPALPFGGAAGTAGIGNFGFNGSPGRTGMYFQGVTLACNAGNGGNSFFGQGGAGPIPWSNSFVAGMAGSGYGGGGSGGGAQNVGAGAIGAAGAPGCVLITEFCRQ